MTLKMEEDVAQTLTEYRLKYFPAERNYLDAHITLFHKLPEESREVWQAELVRVAASTIPFEFSLSSVFSLGGGFAVKVESPALVTLKEKLVKSWSEFLTPQDRQKFNPHCTIQNKVAPARAREDLRKFQLEWEPRTATAQGLQLWNYLNGPWQLERELLFSGRD